MIRDRITDFRRVKASDLLPNPRNWRTHPKGQQDALRGILAEVGYADALLARETPNGLMLIDGHLRAETTPDQDVPVLVLDVNEAEADLLLASLDPLAAMAGASQDKLAAMAGASQDKLAALLADVGTGSDALQAMLESLARVKTPIVDAIAEWSGMPNYEHEDQTAYRSLVVHFASQEHVDIFARLINQGIGQSMKSIWFPPAAIGHFADRQFEDEP